MPACLTRIYPQSKHIRFSTGQPHEPTATEATPQTDPQTLTPIAPSLPRYLTDRYLRRS